MSKRNSLSHALSFVRRTTLTSESSSLPRLLALTTAGLLLAALPAFAKSKPAPVQTAVIVNTGSTNTTGYQLQVSSDGSTAVSTGSISGTTQTVVARSMAGTVKDINKLFHDLNAAMPLTSLPVRHGMRSASFGTSTYITYKGQKSPDLTFATDPRTVALKNDVDAITKALHATNAPRHPIILRQSDKPFGNGTFQKRF